MLPVKENGNEVEHIGVGFGLGAGSALDVRVVWGPRGGAVRLGATANAASASRITNPGSRAKVKEVRHAGFRRFQQSEVGPIGRESCEGHRCDVARRS